MKKIIIGMATALCFFSACNTNTSTTLKGNDSTASSAEKNKQTALNNEKAFINKDVNAAFKDYTADFVEYGNGESKPMKNQDSMKLDMKNFFTAFPDFKGENLKTVAAGDSVVVIGDWSGTFKSEYRKMKPTQKSFKITEADIYTFNKAGKITSHKGVQGNETAFYQLGIPMPAKK